MNARSIGLLGAAKWTVISNILQEISTAGLTLILAAFLAPIEFGVVAMGLIYVSFIELILGFGFSVAVVQRRDLNDLHLNSVFWLNQVTGMVFAIVAILLSGWWSNLSALPSLEPMLIVLSLTIPLQSLSIVQVALLQRKMQFKDLAIRNNLATIFGGVVGVSCAVAGLGAWSLVWQYVSRSLASLGLLWKVSDWRPKLAFSQKALRDLSGFAGKTFLGQFGVFTQQQADSLVIGMVLGPAALGIYRLADRLVEMNLKFFSRALQVVSLPHFSKLQDNPEELNRSVLLGLHLNCMVTFPAMAFLAGASSVILDAVGRQWADGSGILRILCLVGISKSLLMLLGPLLQAKSRPGANSLNTWALAISNAIVAIACARFFEQSSDMTRTFAVASGRAAVFLMVFTPIVFWQARKVTHLSMASVFNVIKPAALSSVAIIIILQFVIFLLPRIGLGGVFVRLALCGGVGFVGWILCVRLLDRRGWSYVQKAASRIGLGTRRLSGA